MMFKLDIDQDFLDQADYLGLGCVFCNIPRLSISFRKLYCFLDVRFSCMKG